MNSNPNPKPKVSPAYKEITIGSQFQVDLKKRYISPSHTSGLAKTGKKSRTAEFGSRVKDVDTYSFEDNELKAKISKVHESDLALAQKFKIMSVLVK